MITTNMKVFVGVSLLAFIPCVLSVLDKNLNSNCAADEDCAIAYSFCDKGQRKCVCMKGFTANSTGFCQSPGLACPIWAGVGSPQSLPGKSCTWRFDQTGGREVHSCGNGQFCHVHPKTQTATGDLEYVGHCCPNPPNNVPVTVLCPLTVNEPGGTCPDMTGVPADMAVTGSQLRTCPYDTHDCVQYERVNLRRGAACCPLPCIGASSHFSVNGKCYDTAMINDPCTVTAQCGGRSTCKPSRNGKSTCQCNGRVIDEPSPHCE